MMDRFWMVYMNGSDKGTTHKHFHIETAFAEARRLAACYPNRRIFIMGIVSSFEATAVVREYMEFTSGGESSIPHRPSTGDTESDASV